MRIKLKNFISIFFLSICAFSFFSVKAMKPAVFSTQKQIFEEFSSKFFEKISMPYDDGMPSFVQSPDWQLYSVREFPKSDLYYNHVPITSLLCLRNFVGGYIRDLYVYTNNKFELHPRPSSFYNLNQEIEEFGGRLEDVDNVIYMDGSFDGKFLSKFLKNSIKQRCIINITDGKPMKIIEVYGPKGSGKAMRRVIFFLSSNDIYQNIKRKFCQGDFDDFLLSYNY